MSDPKMPEWYTLAYLDGQRDALLAVREAVDDILRALPPAPTATDAGGSFVQVDDPNRLVPRPEERPYTGEAGC